MVKWAILKMLLWIRPSETELKEAKLMFMASSVKEYHMFSLSLLFFVNSVSWIMIRVGHDVSRGGIES